jgi:hypothetical protein
MQTLAPEQMGAQIDKWMHNLVKRAIRFVCHLSFSYTHALIHVRATKSVLCQVGHA